MESVGVVEALDVLEQSLLGLLSRSIGIVIDEFGFESSKEAFHDGVIVAIASAAHAGQTTIYLQKLLVIVAGILHAPITVMHQALLRPTISESLLQSLADQLRSQMIGSTPADYLS